jgi:excisionase family DNA binding protein
LGKLLVDVREAEEILGVGPRKIRELADAGKVERIRLGTRSVRFTRESIERLARPQQDDNGA